MNSNKNYFNELKELMKLSYSPYSNFPVAAIIINGKGQIFKGVNVENASYPSGLCAERSALFGSVANGFKVGDIKEIHIISNNIKPISPCFGCRQVITEFTKPDSLIFLYSSNGQDVHKFTVAELCPLPILNDDILKKGN